MSLTFEHDLARVKKNQHAKYIPVGQTYFAGKLSTAHTRTRTTDWLLYTTIKIS